MWTSMRSRGFTLVDLARLMAEKPAELAGLQGRKGRIAPGYDADFVVFDPSEEFVLKAEQLHTRHPISPYVGERLFGTVSATYLRGERVYAEGKFADRARGEEISGN
jgi:allantoinase